MTPLVIVESPYAGNIEANEEFAQLCLADCFDRGEAPFASHLLYTQDNVLDDMVPEERQLGIKAGHLWMRRADKVVVYCDRGFSSGMIEGIKRARAIGLPIEFRRLDGLASYDELEEMELQFDAD